MMTSEILLHTATLKHSMEMAVEMEGSFSTRSFAVKSSYLYLFISYATIYYNNGNDSQPQLSGPFWNVGLQVTKATADLKTMYAYSLLPEHGNTMQPQDTLSPFAGVQNDQFPFQLDDYVHGESHPNSLAIGGGLSDSRDHFAGLTSYTPESQMFPDPSDQYESLHSHQAHRGEITRPVNTGTNPSQTLLDQKSFYLDSLKNFDDVLSSYYHRKQLRRMEGQTPGIIAFLDFPMYNSENKLTAIRFGTKCLHMRNNNDKANWASFCRPGKTGFSKRTAPPERAARQAAEQSIEDLLPRPQALKNLLSKAWQVAFKEMNTGRERWLPTFGTEVNYNTLSRMSQLVEGRMNRHLIDATIKASNVPVDVRSITTFRRTRDDVTFAGCSASPDLLHITNLFPSVAGQFSPEVASQFDSIELDPEIPIPNFIVGSVDLSGYELE
jgi:hypothetical protein